MNRSINNAFILLLLLLSRASVFSQSGYNKGHIFYFSKSDALHATEGIMADSSYSLFLEKIDTNYATSVAHLNYVKENGIVLKEKNIRKSLLSYNQLVHHLKNEKDDFFKRNKFYIIERLSSKKYKAYPVIEASYMEWEKEMTDVLKDF